MSRIHLFELEDQPWFPELLRNYLTDLLNEQLSSTDLYGPIVPHLKAALEATGAEQVLDLCSGGGGPIQRVRVHLEQQMGRPISFTLSDRYPHLEGFERAKRESGGAIQYVTEPVDARRVPSHLKGFRTLFTAMHHFPPDVAQSILQDAVNTRSGIGVFEGTERCFTSMVAMAVSPLLNMVSTLKIRPFRWSRIALTYAVPVMPAVYMWDGVVSHLRTYSPEELRALVARLDAPDYVWNIGQAKHPKIPMRLTYLTGYPRPEARA